MGIILAICAVAACTYMGFRAGGKYIKREKLFGETLVFCENLSSQIGFHQRPLAEIILKEAESAESVLYDLLKAYYMILAERQPTDSVCLQERIKCRYLSDGELGLYLRLFESLGKSSGEFQIKGIDEFKSSVDKLHVYSLSDKNKFSGVYKKVGFLCGLVLAVVFV